MADSVTFKKGKFKIIAGVNKEREVEGTVSSSGLGIYKSGGNTSYSHYTIVQLYSGLAITGADSLKEAKIKAERISGVTNWKKKVKPTQALLRKTKAAERGEKVSGRKLDTYDIKARYRKPPAHVVEEKKAEGYKDQRQKRGQIRRDLHGRHIGYTTEVYNESRQYYLKRPKGK